MENRRSILITAWIVILSTGLFKIIAQELFHFPVSENLNFLIGLAIILSGLLLTFLWKATRPLRSFFLLYLVLLATQWLVFTKLDEVPFILTLLHNPSFNVYMLSEQVLKLIIALVIIAFLFILKKKRESFFLTRGDTRALVEPIKWLGVKSGEKWNKFGAILTVCISLGTLTFLVIAGRPPLNIIVKTLPFLPAVLLAAAMNAFYEEMTYKASFLAVLEDAVGKQQALLLMAVLFGLLHYYGVPYGIIGVIMATFLGWILGKSMLETRGLFWAWFIHFWQDVLIFGFLAIGFITPGG